jgi:ABC-type bacteriocin/lantibiotic exporter with double-glycine peptidase domain
LIDEAYPSRDFILLGWLCAAMLGMSVMSRTISVISQYHAAYVQAFIEYKLSFRVFAAIHRLPPSYREQCGFGGILVRTTSDVQAVAQSVTRLLPDIVTTVFTFVVAIPLMLTISPAITGIVLAVVPVNYLITAHLTGRAVRLRMTACTVTEDTTAFIRETIEGVTLSRIFSLERIRRGQLANLLRKRLEVVFAMWRANTMWGQLAGLINTLWGTVLLCGGWYLVFSDRLQLGQAVALSMYVGVLTRPFEQLALLYQSLLADSVGARRLLDLLDAGQAPIQLARQKVLKAPPRRYELHRLSFGYTEQRLCLQDLDLCLRAGQTVAVIGPTGGGKSTLLRILCGLEDGYRGQFTVDGHDLCGIDRDSYLQYVSWVPQSTFFFSGPIRSNLPGNGSTATEHLRECACVLGLNAVIDAMPEGFSTRLGSKGVELSAGQYQKLAVLRAILKDAAVLLLDEVTASLDIESERKLLQGVLALRPAGCLTLLVTHHIPITVEPWIDEIIVLVDGRIVEKGSSTQLWERGGFYHHWLDICRGATRNSGILPHQTEMT